MSPNCCTGSLSRWLAVTLLASSIFIASGSRAADYPARPISIIVPFPASAGGTNAIMRVLGERMKTALGQPVTVENVAGAGGSIGVAKAVRAAPDGYTLSGGQWASHMGSGAVYPVKYDLLTDLVPIAYLGSNPMWIIVRNDLPARDLKELLAWMRGNPGKASVATVGPGSASHLCMLNVQDQTGTQFQMVPYKGGEAVQDLMGGHVDLMCDQAGNSLALVRGGKLRALAVMGTARWFAAPDVPTSQEQGTPGLEIEFWYGLWAPKGTPGEVIAKLNAAVRTGLADPVVRERLTDFGIAPPTAEQLTPAYLAELQRAEIAKWWPRIKAANIKIE